MKRFTGVVSSDALVAAQVEDPLAALRREACGWPELLLQQRNAFGAPAAMAERVLHGDLAGAAAVVEEHFHGVGDGALVRLQVFTAVARLLDDLHFLAQAVDQRVGGVEGVRSARPPGRRRSAARRSCTAGNGRGSRVGQRADLGNDADRRLVGGDDDAADPLQAVLHQRMAGARRPRRRSARGIRRGKLILNSTVFHHVAAVALGKLKRRLSSGLGRQVLAGVAEQDIVETPLRRAEHAGDAHLAAQAMSARRAAGSSRRQRPRTCAEPAFGA